MAKGKGGATKSSAVVGWVFIDRHLPNGFTVRWRRGDAVAYILDANQVGEHSNSGVVATIPVLPAGWTDLEDIQALGERWVQRRAAGA